MTSVDSLNSTVKDLQGKSGLFRPQRTLVEHLLRAREAINLTLGNQSCPSLADNDEDVSSTSRQLHVLALPILHRRQPLLAQQRRFCDVRLGRHRQTWKTPLPQPEVK